MANAPSIVLVHGFWGGAAHWPSRPEEVCALIDEAARAIT